MTMRFLNIFLIALLLSGCHYFKSYHRYTEQASYHLKIEEYYKAVAKSVKALERQPQHEKAKTVLAAAYQDFAQDLMNKTEEDEKVTVEEKVEMLTTAKKLNERIRALQSRTDIPNLELESFTDALAAENEKLYVQADSIYQLGGRKNVMQAALLFKQSAKSNYKDAALRYQKSKSEATLHIAVLPIVNSSSTKIKGFDKEGNTYAELLGRNIKKVKSYHDQLEFTSYINSTQITGKVNQLKAGGSRLNVPNSLSIGQQLKAHKVVLIEITDIEYQTEDKEYGNETFEKQKKAGTKTVDGKKITQYRTLKANGEVHAKMASAKLSLLCTISDTENSLLNKKIPLEYTTSATNRWVTRVTGDREAVSLPIGRSEVEYPSLDQLVSSIFTSYLRNDIPNKLTPFLQ